MTRKHHEDRREQTIRCVLAIAKAISGVVAVLILLLHGN